MQEGAQAAIAQAAATPIEETSCVTCHFDADLFEPEEIAAIEGFHDDIHAEVGLSCHDCHGGNPDPALAEDYSGAKDASKCGLCAKGESSLEPIGWYCGNSGNTTHPVGKKTPNAWGLVDMSGNMWEWCHDWYVENLGAAAATDPAGPTSGTYKVLRGGSHESLNRDTRAATRRGDQPYQQYNSYGFRCVRSL